jgi:DegV family protein with EDD domain
MKIALVTDSTCDIPIEFVDAYQIHVVPNILVMEGISVEDDRSFSRQKFYEQLPKMRSFPTTSTASVGRYEQEYREIINTGFEQILSIHCSQQLSGIYNAATNAANSFPGRVIVIDRQQVNMGLGLQVFTRIPAAGRKSFLDTSQFGNFAEVETFCRGRKRSCPQSGPGKDSQKRIRSIV